MFNHGNALTLRCDLDTLAGRGLGQTAFGSIILKLNTVMITLQFSQRDRIGGRFLDRSGDFGKALSHHRFLAFQRFNLAVNLGNLQIKR